MRKQFLVLETTQFDRVQEPPPPRNQVRAEVAFNADGRPVVAPRQAVAQPRHEPELLRQAAIITFNNIHEAEEYVENILHDSPQLKFIVFESVAFLETVASPTVRKMWDANGQLIER